MGANLPGIHDAPRGIRASRRRLRDTLTAYLFISPSALIIGVFGIFPVFFTVYVSLFRWRLTRGNFSGLDNFARLFGISLAALAVVAAALAGMAAAVILLRRSGPGGLPPVLRRATGFGVLGVSAAALLIALPFLASQGDTDIG